MFLGVLGPPVARAHACVLCVCCVCVCVRVLACCFTLCYLGVAPLARHGVVLQAHDDPTAAAVERMVQAAWTWPVG